MALAIESGSTALCLSQLLEKWMQHVSLASNQARKMDLVMVSTSDPTAF